MDQQTVTVDRSQSPARITFAPGFNVATAFVDRHLAEGRGAKVAIRSAAAGDVTYAELVEGVNRCGNALLGLGVRRGERLLLVVKDCPEFFYLFWGAIKAGIVPVPLNTLLRADDYRYIIEDSRCTAVVWSRSTRARSSPRSRPPAEAGGGPPGGGRRAQRPRGARAARPELTRSRRRRPPPASGSTPRARPGGPRAPSTATATWW